MKKTGLALQITAGIVSAMLLASGCAKKGCTDKDAENYCDKCKKDDGSCTYKGSIVFWWNQSFRDSVAAYGISSIQMYFDNVFVGSLAVNSQYWNSPPSCDGANGTVTVTKSLGNNKSKSFSAWYKLVDGNGNVVGQSSQRSITLEANTCIQYQLEW